MRCLLAFFGLVALVSPAVAPPVVTIGVLRRDAMIVPFATYDGKEWKDYWPDPRSDVEVPVSLSSVPRRWWGPAEPLAAWQIWTDSTSQTVHVREPDWLQTHCQKQIGLRTDYQPREWPPGPDAQPYPKDGLAVSPPQAVQPIERLTSDSVEGQGLAEGVRVAFNLREAEGVARAEDDGANVHPGKKELETLPITIEAAYAFGTKRRAYWVEATREYKKGATCGADLFGSGWFLIDADKLASVVFNVQMVPCDREGVDYMLPLGVMSFPRGVYWIAQWSGWNREEYAIMEIRSKAVVPVLSVWGGGC